MVVEGLSSGVGEAVFSSWESAGVMKLKAAMPTSDVISFIWISFCDLRREQNGRKIWSPSQRPRHFSGSIRVILRERIRLILTGQELLRAESNAEALDLRSVGCAWKPVDEVTCAD